MAQRYGITERKKAELNALTVQFNNTQLHADSLRAAVVLFGGKADNLKSDLAIAESNLSQASANNDLIIQTCNEVNNLKTNSKSTLLATARLNKQNKKIVAEAKTMLDELTLFVKVIDNLSDLIIRKKTLNPLISDDLVSSVAAATAGAHNAVALTLVALQSALAVQVSNSLVKEAFASQCNSVTGLCEILMGKKGHTQEKSELLKLRLFDAYQKAKAIHKQTTAALKITIKQLDKATSDLSKTEIQLQSFQCALKAANAAALAV